MNDSLKKLRRAMTSGALALATMMVFVSPAMAEGNETIIIFTPGLFTTTTSGVVLTAVDGVSSTTSSMRRLFVAARSSTVLQDRQELESLSVRAVHLDETHI